MTRETTAARPATADQEAAPVPVPDLRSRWARRITDNADPKNVILVVVPVLSVVKDGLLGLAWAAFAVVFAAVIPTLFIRKRGGDRHVGDRRRRVLVIPFIMTSVLVCLAVMVLAHAPRDLVAMVVAMFATLVPILVITAWWKVSVHTAVSGGAVAILALVLGVWWLLGYLLVAVIAWSRVVLRDHTLAQTLVGTAVGTLTAGATFWWSR